MTTVGDRLWIELQLEAFASSGGTDATVVLGFHQTLFLERCPWLTTGFFQGLAIHLAINPDPDRGPFSSLQTGIAEKHGAHFLLPVDVPAPPPVVWQGLANALRLYQVAQPTYQNRAGHPILLADSFLVRLRHTPSDARLDHLVRALPASEKARFPVDSPEILRNLNTPADWSHYV